MGSQADIRRSATEGPRWGRRGQSGGRITSKYSLFGRRPKSARGVSR